MMLSGAAARSTHHDQRGGRSEGMNPMRTPLPSSAGDIERCAMALQHTYFHDGQPRPVPPVSGSGCVRAIEAPNQTQTMLWRDARPVSRIGKPPSIKARPRPR